MAPVYLYHLGLMVMHMDSFNALSIIKLTVLKDQWDIFKRMTCMISSFTEVCEVIKVFMSFCDKKDAGSREISVVFLFIVDLHTK